MTTAPAGWYAQPDGTERYWDGLSWTNSVRAGVGSQPPAYGQAYGQSGYGPAGQAIPVTGPMAYPQDGVSGYAPTPPPGPMPQQSSLPVPVYGHPGMYPPARKSPGLSLLVSFFIPGVGSMVNGEVGKGIAILLLYLISWPLLFVLVGIPMMLGVWIWGMVDAYTGAQNYNRRHGYPF